MPKSSPEKLAAALRANLSRRKAASQKPGVQPPGAPAGDRPKTQPALPEKPKKPA